MHLCKNHAFSVCLAYVLGHLVSEKSKMSRSCHNHYHLHLLSIREVAGTLLSAVQYNQIPLHRFCEVVLWSPLLGVYAFIV